MVFMMSERAMDAVKNVVFFSNGSTLIKLPVMFTNLRNFLCRNEMSEDDKEIMPRCFSLHVVENKRPDPGQHQLTSDGGQQRQPRLV